MADSIARQKSYTFAIAVIRLCTQLKEQKQFEIASQLLRCGSKEAREANYWLRLLTDTQILADEEGRELLGQSKELIKILTSIVKTTTSSEGPGRSNSELKTKH